ncbi:hypothetical protein [Clostridium sp. DJ247]|uniref:hypothetical protein n=1 Tax=Clostridium sp. DJ247 TaxID=2726188 RepID=UPI0016273AB7|nr:hypothetical protein [Clostridium sp. DJ247]MBC2581184.1 hypothetical protein [Clostridium sp. DJ247]
MTYKQVKVRLKENVTNTEFWEATYSSSSNLGIRLVNNFDKMKKEYLSGKLYKYGSLEVEIPISYYNRENETIDNDVIEYGYVKSTKDIWEIVE